MKKRQENGQGLLTLLSHKSHIHVSIFKYVTIEVRYLLPTSGGKKTL